MKNILVVDDEEPIRNLTKRLLESGGYQVILAADGSEALEYMKQNQGIDLVVSDVLMPEMNGIRGSKTYIKKEVCQFLLSSSQQGMLGAWIARFRNYLKAESFKSLIEDRLCSS